MQLNRKLLAENSVTGFIQKPPESVFDLPEKVLQFGTGVLLRGLPDYYIDKANKQGHFNGRVVMVKSTGNNVGEFTDQDNLYTHIIKGVDNDKPDKICIINTSVSRVLSASLQWKEILQCAKNADMQIVISNTTEVGIQLQHHDNIDAEPPASFPGKLLAFLYHRFVYFKGSAESGMVIIPTELITDNGTRLKQILIELAYINKLDGYFIQWLDTANNFCNSLVDRIVPGALSTEEQISFESMAGYSDKLTIMSEPYSLWAIETTNKKAIETLSFSKTDDSVIIAPQIYKYRELKLRLLNATHTVCCGLAYFSGFTYVCDAMQDKDFKNFITALMLNEIVPCITGNDITNEEAIAFAYKVIERFSNPFIQHKWTSIAVQYTAKFRLRVIPLLTKYIETKNELPYCMMAGFAAYVLYMKPVNKNANYYFAINKDVEYKIEDDKANWFYEIWKKTNYNQIADAVINKKELWETSLARLKNISSGLQSCVKQLHNKDSRQLLQYIASVNNIRSIYSS